MRWAGSGADGRGLDREREKEREVVLFWRARLRSFRLSTVIVAARRRGPGHSLSDY